MADDGVVINFAAPTTPFWEPKPVFKGGRWKDRLTAKKSAAYGALKRKERAEGDTPTEDSQEINNNGPWTKRRRVDELSSVDKQSRNVGEKQVYDQQQDQRPPRTGQRKSTVPKEVISSLFSYNPSSTTTTTNTTDATQDTSNDANTSSIDAAPSNAPLPPESDNFTSLQLSQSLITHLVTKLNLKSPTSIQRKAVPRLISDDSDAFIQAQTGSGKTLAYLLPIVQRLVTLSEALKTKHSADDSGGGNGLSRDAGLFAIILAPTRELCKQISVVLENLLGCAHWIVSGTVSGGEKKKSEKARLRKGINILVATPGRLADHLSNTEVLDVSKVRWLVLDEGDRLMELGFEQDIQKIVSILNLRMRDVATTEITALLPSKRMTILCSATLKMDVQRLGAISLKDANHITADDVGTTAEPGAPNETDAFLAPSQLQQSYAVVPAKQRLVTLVAVLRKAFARRGTTMKTMIFLSCADSVDFHFEVLTRSLNGTPENKDTSDKNIALIEQSTTKPLANGKIPQKSLIAETKTSALATAFSVPNNAVTLYRLHGSLPQAVRTSALQAFAKSTEPSVLICTDVASRGLDVPNVDFVIEYDPSFSRDDHLHRIGRTARAGKPGRAMIFLMPGCEEGYVSVLKSGRGDANSHITRHDAEELLRRGFSATSGVISKSQQWDEMATNFQLDVERWALDNVKHLEQARRAFQSHVRAYATHVASERSYFDIKELHLGHLCKAFALRDRPGAIKVPGLRQGKDAVKAGRTMSAKSASRSHNNASARDDDTDDRVAAPSNGLSEARKKMAAKMKTMSGASEFNLG